MHRRFLEELIQLEKTIEDRANGASNTDEEQALKLFRKIWSEVPREWKLSCQIPIGDTATPKPLRDRLRIDKWSRDPITVPENVLTSLRLWDDNPSSFFVIELESFSSNDPFTRLFRLLHEAAGGDPTIQAIRLRVGQIGLSRLKERLGRCQLRPDTCIEKEFLDRIQFDGDPEEIGKAKKWTTVGRKNDLLSTDLGGLGSMICMPKDVTLAKLGRIPSEGDTRKEAISCLQHRGINDQAKTDIKLCYDVAEKIAGVMQGESDSFFLQYEPPLQTPLKKRKREQTGGHEKRLLRQVVEQERSRNRQTSASPRPVVASSETSLDPQTPAQPIALLNVGGAARQTEGIEGPNSASIPSVIEVHDLEGMNPGTSTCTSGSLSSVPFGSLCPTPQNPGQIPPQAVVATGEGAQTSGGQTAGQKVDSIPVISNGDNAIQSEGIDNDIIDTPRDSCSSVDLATLLFYPPTAEIDLADHLFYQQVFGDTSVHLETYLPDHHDRYTESENLEGMISG